MTDNLETISEYDVALFRKTREMLTLRNRINRMQKKLILEGIDVAKEQGVSPIIPKLDEGYNVAGLISLANLRNSNASLHRRYQRANEKYASSLEELKVLRELVD